MPTGHTPDQNIAVDWCHKHHNGTNLNKLRGNGYLGKSAYQL